MYLIALLLAASAGACISIQAAANASLRAHLADARWATFFSIAGTIVTATIVMLLVRPTFPSASTLRSAPWWNWIGGPLGAAIVLSGSALTWRLGAAGFIAAIVAGQLICSIALDHFALMEVPRNPVTLSRAVGAVLVMAGALLITARR